MKIISGKNKGTKLFSPFGIITRPSSNRLRESMMGILGGGRFGKPLHSEIIIDLFSGTGSLGLEAASRGNPESIIFVENNLNVISILKSNIYKMNLTSQSTILNVNAAKILSWNIKPSELIFSDPPYYSELSNQALNQLSKLHAIKHNALAIVETSKKEPLPKADNFRLIETRSIGKSNIHFLRYH